MSKAEKEPNGAGMRTNDTKGKRKVCGMHKKSRIELGCALMTIQSKSKVCRLRKKCRMELGYGRLSLKGKSKVFGMQKRA